MGNTFGRPFDLGRQRAILLDALRMLEMVTAAGTLRDSPYEWDEAFELKLGGSGARQTTA
jgi:hypothetical protein